MVLGGVERNRATTAPTARTRRGWPVAMALLVCCVTFSTLAVGTARAAGNGSMSGLVTATESGLPVTGVTVTLHDQTYGGLLATTTTQADGTYAIAVPARTYKVRFVDPTGLRVTTWSGGASTFSAAAPVVVSDGANAVANVTLTRNARLHGTVTVVESGLPAANVVVSLYNIYGTVSRTTSTAADGTWLIEGIGGGTWAVSFNDPAGALASRFYANAPTYGAATKLTLAAGSDVVVDQGLSNSGSLKGQATVGGLPWPGARAVIIDAANAIAGSQDTGADGRWLINGLAPGGYRVGYIDPAATASVALRQVVVPNHDAQDDQDGAVAAGQVFTVAAGATVETGTQAMVGLGCDPDELFPGAVVQVANLTNRDLRGCDLTGAKLWGSNLTGSDLTLAKIKAADLRLVSGLVTSNITGTNHDWTSARLSGTGLDLSDVDFQAGGYLLNGTDLAGLDLSGADFTGRDLRNADLRDTDLTGARFANLVFDFPGLEIWRGWLEWNDVALTTGTKVAGADLTDATMTAYQSRLLNPDWRGTTFTGTQFAETLPSFFGTSDSTFETWCTSCDGQSLDRPVGFSAIPNFLPAANLSNRQLAGAVFGPTSEGEGFSFRQVDLHGVDATGLECARCDLSGANLSGATLAGADLTTADLAGADLSGANLNDALLDAADTVGVDLTGATIVGTDISGLDLRTATGLTGVQVMTTGNDWRSTKLPAVDLSGQVLTGRDLDHAGLTGVNLAGTTITGVDLSFASGLTAAQLAATNHNWTGTNLSSTGLDLTGVDFAAGGYQLAGVSFRGVNLTNTNWTGVDLTGVVFSGANLTGATGIDWNANSWALADLYQTKLVGQDLSNVNFSGANLNGADLSSANLTNANLTNAKLTAAKFVTADLTGAIFTGAQTYSADFTSADLAGVSLAGRNLGYSRLNGADLTGTTLTGAFVNHADFRNAIGMTRAQITSTNHAWEAIRLSSTGLNLWGLNFTGYDLALADFQGLNLAWANLTGVFATGIDLRGAAIGGMVITGADLRSAYVSGTQLKSTNHNWAGTNFEGVLVLLNGTDFTTGGYTFTGSTFGTFNFTDANFAGVDLSGVQMPSYGVTFTNANFTGTIIRGADMWNAKGFTAAQLLSADRDWTGTHLPQGPLTGAIAAENLDFVALGAQMVGTWMYRWDLDGSNFAGMDLSDTVFLHNWMRDTDFTGANLSDASLVESLMSGADLSGANLTGADMSNVTGLPHGGATANFIGATCPDRVVVDGTNVTTCVGHGVTA